MGYYSRVFRQCVKNSLSYLMAYRADFFFKMLAGLGWSLTSIGIIEVIFAHTGSLAGWSKTDLILVLFTFTLVTDVSGAIARHVESLERLVRLGQFDGFITKPIDSQFLVVFGRPDFTTFFFSGSRIVPYIYLLMHYNATIYWEYLPHYLFLVFCGGIIWLCIKTMAMTLNFWWQHLDNIVMLLYTIMEIGKYPVAIFPSVLQAIFYTILPLAFMALVPVDALRGTWSWTLILGAIAVTLVLMVFCRLFWLKAIRGYTSASS